MSERSFLIRYKHSDIENGLSYGTEEVCANNISEAISCFAYYEYDDDGCRNKVEKDIVAVYDMSTVEEKYYKVTFDYEYGSIDTETLIGSAKADDNMYYMSPG